MYVLRKTGTDEYLTEGAGYGPLADAYVYHDLEQARDEQAPDDDVVEVTLAVGAVVARAQTAGAAP